VNGVFWHVTPCSQGGRRYLHIQCRRVRQAQNQQETGSVQGCFYRLYGVTSHSHGPENLRSNSLNVYFRHFKLQDSLSWYWHPCYIHCYRSILAYSSGSKVVLKHVFVLEYGISTAWLWDLHLNSFITPEINCKIYLLFPNVVLLETKNSYNGGTNAK
jgi:hypothetical protein